ncbi:radical SAM protein [Catellatospora sp. NPDC049133]|uniref:radical SAM protein n=1 Tax=Catellatospora sp. NPDC049133 TaxID=3155499 RepID=UPI0033C66E2C
MTMTIEAAPDMPSVNRPGRLLAGRDGWWAVHEDRVARLPGHAARETAHGPELVDEARAALEGQHFFAAPVQTTYAITVLTATACNLGCSYCFQNTALPAEGSFAPPRMPKAVLSGEGVARIADFVRGQMARYGFTESSLLLFGGEPLLNPAGALDMLRAMQPLGLHKAEIITNGVPLTRRRAVELADAGLRRVQITFDGARHNHDTIRVTRNGKGTYDTILRNVRNAAEATDLSWHFRVNISHRTVDSLGALVEDLAAAVPAERASLHLALIDDIGLGYDNKVAYTDDYLEKVVALHDQAIGHGMYIPLSKPLTACQYCSAFGGTRGAVVNADGRLYSCWETAGRDEAWVVGDVSTGFLPDDVIRDRWVACDFDIKSHGSHEQTRKFFDRVDAAALDAMYEQRRRRATI